MEHGRELGCDDELATPWRRPTEIEGTGLEGTPFESTRAHNKEGGIRKCLMQALRDGAHTARQASVGNGPRGGRKKGWTHVQPPLKSRVPVACDYRASGAITSDAS